MVPVDEKRRWILARLLDIPPVLFGLEELQGMITTTHIFRWERVDIQEYRTALETYCASYHLGIGLQSLQDIKNRITNLQNEAHYYKSAPDKQQMLELLCQYIIFASVIAREYQDFDTAIKLLRKAITVAERGKLYNLWGQALRARGIIYVAKAEVTAYQDSPSTAQSDFTAAALDFTKAQQLGTHLSPLPKGLITLSVGAVSAYMAQDRQGLKAALKSIDEGRSQIGESTEKLLMWARCDDEMLLLDMAEMYLSAPLKNLCSPQLARNALEQATKKTAFPSKTRQARNTFLLAKSYFIEGNYPMATAYAESAIDSVQASISPRYAARLNYLYRGLLASPYGKDTDVGNLGIKLLKVQKPELF